MAEEYIALITAPMAPCFAALGDGFAVAVHKGLGGSLDELLAMHFADVFILSAERGWEFREAPSGLVRMQMVEAPLSLSPAIAVRPGKRLVDLVEAVAALLGRAVQQVEGWPVIAAGFAAQQEVQP